MQGDYHSQCLGDQESAHKHPRGRSTSRRPSTPQCLPDEKGGWSRSPEHKSRQSGHSWWGEQVAPPARHNRWNLSARHLKKSTYWSELTSPTFWHPASHDVVAEVNPMSSWLVGLDAQWTSGWRRKDISASFIQTNNSLQQIFERFWKLDDPNHINDDSLLLIDKQVLGLWNKQMVRDNNHYTLPILFKSAHLNFRAIMHRLHLLLRFLWWEDDDPDKPPKHHHTTAHLFGDIWSPSAATFALQKVAEDNCGRISDGALETIGKNFYMDDCLKSMSTVDTAIGLATELRELLALLWLSTPRKFTHLTLVPTMPPKYTIILPKDHRITRLIIYHYHLHLGHAGPERVLAEIRQCFWILKALLQNQQMADLPDSRLTTSEHPFTHVGLDYFGPFLVKNACIEIKWYICLFTCLATRAVHLEVAHSLDTDSFMNVLQRFIARRGPPTEIWSDKQHWLCKGTPWAA